jgi:CubicO group peptidase (beta-lactamase class C family)
VFLNPVDLKRTLTLLLLTLALFGCGAGANKKKPEPQANRTDTIPAPYLAPDSIKIYHNLVAEFFRHNHFLNNFSGGILIAKNGVPVYEVYQGFEDRSTKDSMDPASPLQIASTSKPFTAAAILQLVQAGKLSLDARVASFFPGFLYPEVTVRTLLNHRSGLPNYLYYMDEGQSKKFGQEWPRNRMATNADVINTLSTWNVPASYRYNVHFSYCNTNFVLLASIVEKVTGVAFPQYMKTNFFDRFGMTNTFIRTMPDTTANMSYQANGYVHAEDFSDGPYGDKNVYSTPRDLLKWDQAWYNGLVLNKQWTDSAFTPYSNERPSQHNYGLGWRLLFTKTGKKVVYHNGHWHGFNTGFARLIDEQATIIILSNKKNGAVYPIARELYNIFGNYNGKQDPGEE